jgi:hypothetical protein
MRKCQRNRRVVNEAASSAGRADDRAPRPVILTNGRKARWSDYASGVPPQLRLSSETARDISPKQVALAISDDQNTTQSRAGMTISSSADWVTWMLLL